MSKRTFCALLCSFVLLAGCEQLDSLMYGTRAPESPAAQETAGRVMDAVYINPQGQLTGAGLRNVYIAPANLANMQVIQPEGASADSEWWVTEEENQILQAAITYEFSVALGYQSAFNIVHTPAQADIVLNTAVVALHPNETRGSVAKRTSPGGAITVSIVAATAGNEQVMMRFVDTRAGDDIWAFNLVKKDDPAFSSLFRAWGEVVRRGLLQAQGRPAL